MQRFFTHTYKKDAPATTSSSSSSTYAPARKQQCTLRLVSPHITVSLAVRFDTLARQSKFFEQILNNMNEEELAKRELELSDEEDVLGAAQLIEALHAYSDSEDEEEEMHTLIKAGGWNKTWAMLAHKWSIGSLLQSFTQLASSELNRLLTINDLITSFNQPSLDASNLFIVKNSSVAVLGSGCESMNGFYTYTIRNDRRGFAFSRRGEFLGVQGQFFLFPRFGVVDKKCRWYIGFFSKERQPLAPPFDNEEEEENTIFFSAPATSSFAHYLPPSMQWGKEAQALVHNLSQIVVEIKIFEGGAASSEHKEPSLGDVDRKLFWSMAEFILTSPPHDSLSFERDLLCILSKHTDLFDDEEMKLLNQTHMLALLKQLRT